MLSYPSALSVSTRALITLTNALQHSRNQRGTRWRRLPVGRHALLALAHLRKDVTPIRDIAHIATSKLPQHATLLQLLDV